MIAWRTRLSREEVAAHAVAHPIKQWVSREPHAYWLKWCDDDHIEPALVFLGVIDGQLSWQGDKHDGMIDYCAASGTLFLPCTAQGVPVDLLPKEVYPETPSIGDLIREGMRGKVGA